MILDTEKEEMRRECVRLDLWHDSRVTRSAVDLGWPVSAESASKIFGGQGCGTNAISAPAPCANWAEPIDRFGTKHTNDARGDNAPFRSQIGRG